ncbi:MAG: hypothetical protein IKG14_02035 [Clostridia bacterium]|nr:hypothetical protein [Clostridia bacterium]
MVKLSSNKIKTKTILRIILAILCLLFMSSCTNANNVFRDISHSADNLEMQREIANQKI